MSFFSLVYEFPYTGKIHRKHNRVHAGKPVFTFISGLNPAKQQRERNLRRCCSNEILGFL